MKTKTLNKLLKNYKLIFENLGFKISPNFDKEFLHIKRMKTNATKISYIKKDKIEGLEKNVKDFVLKPNDTEQRDKYFIAVKPSRFLGSMVVQDDNKQDLFDRISEQFTKDFINNLKYKFITYSGDEISEQYNKNSSIVGCMSGNDKSWFKVYAKTEGLQLATLKDESGTLLIRALLWYDKETNHYWLDNTYEQSAISGDNDIRQDYQLKLLDNVLHYINVPTLKSQDFKIGCRFRSSLKSNDLEELENGYNLTVCERVQREIVTETINTGKNDKNGDRIYKVEETEVSKNRATLKPLILDFDADDFEFFPYSDTFQSIGRNSGKWFISDNEGCNDFICCRSQDGEDLNNTGAICDCCGERTHEDEIHYSELESEYLCDECARYIDEREEVCRTENSTYNSYSGEYHYTNDLQ